MRPDKGSLKAAVDLGERERSEGNEYKNKYETIYSALEPAILASKERHAKRKNQNKK